MKKKKIILIIVEIAFVGIIAYSGYNIYKWTTENQKTSNLLEQISKEIVVDEDTNTYTVDIAKLKEQNEDTVAYLDIKGTDIRYPVVQAKDNDYYLTHSYDKSYSSAGWIFADYKNKYDGTDKNIVIYGHNRRDGSLFSSLLTILNPEWYENEENRHITLITEDGTKTYDVFSIYQVEDEDYYIQTSFKGKGFSKFLNTITNRSIKDFGIEVTEDDSIITLSTCANDKRYRVVLHAKEHVE